MRSSPLAGSVMKVSSSMINGPDCQRGAVSAAAGTGRLQSGYGGSGRVHSAARVFTVAVSRAGASECDFANQARCDFSRNAGPRTSRR